MAVKSVACSAGEKADPTVWNSAAHLVRSSVAPTGMWSAVQRADPKAEKWVSQTVAHLVVLMESKMVAQSATHWVAQWVYLKAERWVDYLVVMSVCYSVVQKVAKRVVP